MKDFDELFWESVHSTIAWIFGEAPSELMCGLAERQASLKREENGVKIEVFHDYLEKLLGSERTQVVWAASLKCLVINLKQEYEEIKKHLSLLDQLYEAKFKLLVAADSEKKSVCN